MRQCPLQVGIAVVVVIDIEADAGRTAARQLGIDRQVGRSTSRVRLGHCPFSFTQLRGELVRRFEQFRIDRSLYRSARGSLGLRIARVPGPINEHQSENESRDAEEAYCAASPSERRQDAAAPAGGVEEDRSWSHSRAVEVVTNARLNEIPLQMASNARSGSCGTSAHPASTHSARSADSRVQ